MYSQDLVPLRALSAQRKSPGPGQYAVERANAHIFPRSRSPAMWRASEDAGQRQHSKVKEKNFSLTHSHLHSGYCRMRMEEET